MAHVFGERTLATLERLLSLLSAFEVVVWMTDGWPLYESRLKGKLRLRSTLSASVTLSALSDIT
ncbi:Putative transposase [Leclercia adecarboxylata]